MKRLFPLLLLAVAFASCSKTDSMSVKSNAKAETPEDAKQTISDILTEAVEMIDVSEFEPVVKLARECAEIVMDSDFEVIENHFMSYAEANGLALNKTLGSNVGGTVTYVTNFAISASLSGVEGQFELPKGSTKWVKTGSADGLTLTMYDKSGKEVKAALTWSSATSKIHFAEFNNWTHAEYSNYCYKYDGDIEVDFPKQISLSLTHGGSAVASAKISSDVNVPGAIVTDGWPNVELLGTADFSISAAVSVQSLSVTLDELYFKNGNARVQLGLSKGSTRIIGLSLSGKSITYNELTGPGCEGVEAEFDVLSKLQVKGKSNVNSILNLINNGYDSSTLAGAQAYADKLNSVISVGIFFGDDIQQAYMEFSPVSSGRYYYVEPVIVFCKDGTSFSFEEYFTPLNFLSVVNAALDVVNDFSDLVNGE